MFFRVPLYNLLYMDFYCMPKYKLLFTVSYSKSDSMVKRMIKYLFSPPPIDNDYVIVDADNEEEATAKITANMLISLGQDNGGAVTFSKAIKLED